ncbi:MAG TPA: methylenetetrahydrofolate reductase [NAD(P)H] [Desulfohalobiaceae bacterium]|nr:methylenetetrahydrofolate reductase [NAD(P)H] [Desulfohalobiaceae bacterium]
MRVAQLLKKKNGNPTLSFEFFRPKTEKAAQNFEMAINTLSENDPDYVTVTFGAGGSSREGSFELIDKLKNERGFDVVAYIAGVGLGPEDLRTVLDRFGELGVENVFAIRGDEPKGDAAFQSHPEALPHASDLISFIKRRYDFSLGAAGYPEGHLEAESKDEDIEYLKLKQDSGAEYVVAQFFYDNQDFYDFVQRCRKRGITIPILPGIMPIYSHNMLNKLSEVCGAKIPEEVRQGLDEIPAEDKDSVIQFGIDYATKQCQDLLQNGVPGLHFYTMNRAKSVDSIVRNLKQQSLL